MRYWIIRINIRGLGYYHAVDKNNKPFLSGLSNNAYKFFDPVMARMRATDLINRTGREVNVIEKIK